MDVKTGTVLEAILEATRSSEVKVKEETSGHSSCSYLLKITCCLFLFYLVHMMLWQPCYTAYFHASYLGWEVFDTLCTSKRQLLLGVYLLVFDVKSFSVSACVWAVTATLK